MFNVVMRSKCFCFTVAVSALSCLAAHCTHGKDLISDLSACFESLQLVIESRRRSPSINACRPQIGGRSRNPHRLLSMHFGKFSCYPMNELQSNLISEAPGCFQALRRAASESAQQRARSAEDTLCKHRAELLGLANWHFAGSRCTQRLAAGADAGGGPVGECSQALDLQILENFMAEILRR